MEAKIIYKNGSEMNVEMNGNSFILNEKPTFPDDLSEITVQSDTESKTYLNARVQDCASIDGRYWFCFIEESTIERENRMLRNEIESLNNDLTNTQLALVEVYEMIGGV